MQQGDNLLLTELRSNPGNLMPVYLADYEDCLTLLLNSDPEEYEQRKEHFETRLDALEKGDRSSPWYRLCRAGIYMHWAIINTRLGQQYRAALKFRKAFSILKENQNLFPQFEYNSVFAGLQEAVIGSLPGNYQWLVSLFGIKGNLKGGVSKLSFFVRTHNNSQPLYAEAVLYYVYTRFYLLHEQREVWDYMNSGAFPTQNNLLNSFVKSNIAIDNRQSEAATDLLKDMAGDADYAKYPFFELQAGLAMMTNGDVRATDHFQRYLAGNKSDLYIKECWQKMAWVWYINDNMKQAGFCRSQIKGHGTTTLDVDKQAEKFGESGSWPVKKILQGRLLLDGGYTKEAFRVLSTIDIRTLTNAADRAEYFFRLGRVYEESADYKKAITYYQYAMTAGKDRREQFAARAALHTGLVYEHTGRKQEALKSYRQCLAMPGHDFQNSIDQLAKAGVSRVSE